MTRNKNVGRQLMDYDLNIFQREQLDANGEYAHFGPWYIHVYMCEGGTSTELGFPIQLTDDETAKLITNDPYFQDHEPDLWYGLDGFMFSKWDLMSDRLKAIFEGLPKYKDCQVEPSSLAMA